MGFLPLSKAINNTGGLADVTRERILQKAVEMGYKQFSYISARTQKDTMEQKESKKEIALLIGNTIAPAHFASLMLDKLKAELSQLGYTLRTHRVEREDVLCGTLPVTFARDQVCAIICIEMFDRAYDEMICAVGLPVLFVDGPCKRDGKDLPADQLYMDNTTAITRFVNDMLARGKRRIGFIGDYEHCQSFYERYTAFRCAMIMQNAPVEEQFCIKTSDRECLSEALTTLKELPDVFICTKMARGVMVRCMAEIKAQATISQWNRGTLLRMRGFVPEPGDISAASVEALISSLCDNLERHMPDAPEGHRWIMLSCLFLAFVAWEPMHPREVVHHRNTVIMGRQHWFCPVREDSAESLCRFCVCKTESR